MRVIPLDISNKLHSRIQTLANKCNPVLDARICRPETPLVNEVYLERQTVLEGVDATDVSVAVTHPSFGYNYANTKIFLAYISGGVLRVQAAAGKIRMQNHVWSDMGIGIPASACSIALNGTMPKNTKGGAEFITELDPWLFWVYDSVLYGQKVNGGEPVVLAEANCTDVSAVRAMWSSSSGFDFGLVVFFLLSGQLYYRQLIDGEWMDAEVVSFGPDGVTWQEIAAFRTWDYRVGLQCKATDGFVYELFTQFMGIGKQTTEHLDLSANSTGELAEVSYRDTKLSEHVDLSAETHPEFTYGLSSKPIEVYNLDDGTGNYGTMIHVRMDYPIYNAAENQSSFTLIDSNQVVYPCESSSVDDSGKILQLTFSDFNLAESVELTLTYTPGTIQSPATALSGFELSFIGVNLKAPDIPVPEPVSAWNTGVEGDEIAIQFSQPLTGDVSGDAASFQLSGFAYSYIPGGDLEPVSRSVTQVSLDVEDPSIVYLRLGSGMSNNLQSLYGEVKISYSGGTLKGKGGPVDSFELIFLPVNLVAKNNPHTLENVLLRNFSAQGQLLEVYYTSTKELEHISLLASATAALTSIDDL